MQFLNRSQAGRKLAEKLLHYAGRDDVIVLALPRGGVPVGYEVARKLGAPLDVFLVRKLGVPGYEELAMGAIASNGVQILNDSVLRKLQLSNDEIEDVAATERRELERREREYRHDRAPVDVRGKIVLLVDDGLATGSTMRAAVAALRKLEPARIVVAVPVGSPEICKEFEGEADEAICVQEPEPFYAVGVWYEEFDQVSDAEVRSLLQKSRSRPNRRNVLR
ncbi:MAG TPA: phosphoribosyltransferase [Urbifossiella sp.]|nr:phosphoribosyltransferase [Urbifossiella sp.]